MRFITVHNGKKEEERIADILNASISKIDDIETAVWTEQHYKDNKHQITSDQYFVFIGKTSTSENIKTSPEFEVKFKKLNMSYGYLGRQAVISLDNDFSWNDQKMNQFADFHNSIFKDEIEKHRKKKKLIPGEYSPIKAVLSEVDERIKSAPLVAKIVAVPVGLLFFGLFGTITAVTSGTYLVKGKIDNNKVRSDSWNAVSSHFIQNNISNFLGIQSE